LFHKRIQLGLIHMAVAMTLVPINSTLNRVMIKDLGISATLVALLASLPYLISPIQVSIGSFADRHAVRGLRRTPYIALGLILCVLGVILSPYAAYLMAGNSWVGLVVAFLAFGAWGMGYNLSAVSYMSLASEISGEKDFPELIDDIHHISFRRNGIVIDVGKAFPVMTTGDDGICDIRNAAAIPRKGCGFCFTGVVVIIMFRHLLRLPSIRVSPSYSATAKAPP